MRKKWQGFLRKAYRAVKKLSEVLLNNGNTQAQTAELIGSSLRKVAYGRVHGEPLSLW